MYFKVHQVLLVVVVEVLWQVLEVVVHLHKVLMVVMVVILMEIKLVEVVELVLGAPLPDRRLELARALAMPDGGVRLELAGGSGAEREVFVFDAEGRLRHLERATRGRPPWEARFDAYAPVAGTPLAHEIGLGSACGVHILERAAA